MCKIVFKFYYMVLNVLFSVPDNIIPEEYEFLSYKTRCRSHNKVIK